jgi:hypothetical protein
MPPALSQLAASSIASAFPLAHTRFLVSPGSLSQKQPPQLHRRQKWVFVLLRRGRKFQAWCCVMRALLCSVHTHTHTQYVSLALVLMMRVPRQGWCFWQTPPATERAARHQLCIAAKFNFELLNSANSFTHTFLISRGKISFPFLCAGFCQKFSPLCSLAGLFCFGETQNLHVHAN